MSIKETYPYVMPFISSLINPLDIKECLESGYPCNSEVELKLVITNSNNIDLIEKAGYLSLLMDIVNNLEIPDSILPVLESYFKTDIIKFLKEVIAIEKKHITINLDKQSSCIIIKAIPIMNSILYGPLSEIHHSMIETIEQFFQFYLSGLNVFLNAKSNSPVQNFIQEWCFEELHLGMNYYKRI